MSMLALALAAQALSPNPTPAQRRRDDANFCTLARRITRAVQADLPLAVDAVTRLDGASVICSLRTMMWNKSLTIDTSRMIAGWREAKQDQFNRIICDNQAFGPMARRGWRFVTNWTFANGERVIMDAVC